MRAPILTGRVEWLWAGGAFLVAGVSIATMLTHGWVPIDEGTAGLAARYVGDGWMPHRDFAYPYTGALPFLHALASRLFGETLVAPRLVLFAAFVLWLPAIWSLARGYVPAAGAAATVVLAAWWSVLIYPAAMPTWYVLFLATWALVALRTWHATGRTRWLVAAGACVGAAIAIKQTGLYTLVGACLAVLALHQSSAHPRAGTEPGAMRKGDPVVFALLAIAAIAPVLLIVLRGALSGEALTLALPLLAVIATLASRERELVTNLAARRRSLLATWGRLFAGACIVPALLALVYASGGALGALGDALAGGTIRSMRTIDRAMPAAFTILAYGAPLALALAAIGAFARARTLAVTVIAASLVALGAGLLAMYFVWAYHGIWYFAIVLLPATVLGAVWMERRARAACVADEPVILALAATLALHALNQFPYAAPNYFGYVAPLVFLLGAMVAGRAGIARNAIFAIAVLLVFGGWFHRIGSAGTVGEGSIWWDDAHALPGKYGGLKVTRADSAQYARLTALVAEHGGAEAFVAGPEMPALYVLAGTRRLVAQPYLLVAGPGADSAAMASSADLMRARLVAINDSPLFLPRVEGNARAWLERRFPNAERVGLVDVRWR